MADRGVRSWLSSERFEPYVREAHGDEALGAELYEWNVRLAAACFEAFQYVEVILRNALDEQLRLHFDEASRGLPWFLLPVSRQGRVQDRIDEEVNKVRKRLREARPPKESRDQIVANLTFGFWTSLLHSDHDQLWKDCLHRTFPHATGTRSTVAAVLEPLRVFRNRLPTTTRC